MAVNPLLTAFDNLDPAVKQNIMAAHGIALNPLANTAAPVLGAFRHPAAPSSPSAPEPTGTIPPIGQGPTVPPIALSATPKVSGPTPVDIAQQRVSQITSQKPVAESIYSRLTGSGFGQAHPTAAKILGGVGQGLATLGDVGLSAVAPAVAINLPGTAYHHRMLENQASRQLAGAVTNEREQAQTQAEQAQAGEAAERTREMPGTAASEQSLRDEQIENLQSEIDQRKEPDLAHAYAHAVNQAIKQGRDPADDPIVQHLSDAITSIQKQPAEKSLQQVGPIVGPDGKPHTYGVDGQGKKVVDYGVHYEKPEKPDRGDSSHEFAEQERGRGLLDKAEDKYRTAQQSVNGIRAMIDNAKVGDKMSAKMLPLEGALEITTSQGVRRINRTEVDQYAGGGSAFDRLAGMLKGATTGVPFTQEILNSMQRLADIQEKGAYENYKGAYDSATKRYHLIDEQPLAGPASQGGGDIVYDKNGVGHRYKGTGDRKDPNNYEEVKP